MPHLDHAAAADLVKRRHREWQEHQRSWRFLADSLEGGTRYMHADYTIDPTAIVGDGSSFAPWYSYGYDSQTSQPYPVSYRQIVDRNLVPHKREMGTDGKDLYVMRLARTPVPNLVERTAEAHLSKIYAKEITRTGPAALDEWWADADGRGTEIDRWMAEAVAPLMLAVGHLDLCFDHPEAPAGGLIETRADALSAGVTGCIASIILSENMVWWRLDARKARYVECLVFERHDDGVGYRHWTETDSNFYDHDGRFVPGKSRAHKFAAVPIVRVFDRRKVRCENTGRSRYDSVAQIQRAVYNLLSERTLSCVQQSHAQLTGPEDFLQSDSEIPIGPDAILPKKKVYGANGAISYEGWEFVDPPKGAQQDVAELVNYFSDQADRDGTLAKPAGITGPSAVGQSGVSKIADQVDGNAVLARIAETLGEAEEQAAAMALRVLTDGRATPKDYESIEALYPKQFDLYTLSDLASALDDLQRLAASAGALPETEGELMKRLIAVALPGISDDRLTELHDEVDGFLVEAAKPPPTPTTPTDPNADDQVLSGETIATSQGSLLLSPTPSS